MSRFDDVVVVSAADAAYFPLLEDLVESLSAQPVTLAVLDLGLTGDQVAWLRGRRARVVEPGWDVDFPGRDRVPGHYRAMAARPHLPRYFPGFAVYVWLDSDTWLQTPEALGWMVDAARTGALAIVPELDRGYWTTYKPPRLWGQNQKAFAWSYGLAAGYRLGRNPILNVGVFALPGDAPHWAAWARNHAQALARRTPFRRRPRMDNFYFFLSEQTALNRVVFGEGMAATFLPATANWFCGKGTPAWDAERKLLVEPHAPHAPISIVHLAGAGAKERTWRLRVLQGGEIETRLTYRHVARHRVGLTVAEP